MILESLESTQSHLEVNRLEAVIRLEKYLQRPEERVLREHQIDAMESLLEFFQTGETAGYISLPTGSGKSVIIAELAQSLGMRTLVLSPTLQILDQTGRAAEKFTPELSISERHGDSKDISGRVVNTTYQSLGSAIERGEINPSEFDLLVCDEVHTAIGPKRHKIFQSFPHALMVGLTATPFFTQLESYKRRELVRGDEKWTGMFEKGIHDMSLEEAIERGILTNLDINILRTGVSVGSIRTTSGDYNKEDLSRYLNVWIRNSITTGLISGVENIPDGTEIDTQTKKEIERIHVQIKDKKTAIFGIDIDHIQNLARELAMSGKIVRVVHGRIDPNERKKIFDEYENGNVDVLLGVDLIRLGWDSPATEVGIYLSPTRSGVVATQELGRILRTNPGKEKAIAIQLVDLFEKRGQSPILIPNLFDPYFILRGSILLGEGVPGQPSGKAITRPKLRFSGIGIDAIVEQARSQELLKQRINKADIGDLDLFTSDLASRIYAENPETSPIEFYRRFAEELPYRIGANVQEKALQAIASIDSNVASAGKRVLLTLGMRFALTAAEKYFTGDSEVDSDMFHAGIDTFLEEVEDYKRKSAVRPVQDLVEKGIIRFIAERENIPTAWVRKGTYIQIKQAALEIFMNPSSENFDVNELAKETRESAESIEEYVEYLIALRNGPVSASDAGIVESAGDQTGLREATNDILESLDSRSRKVIRLRFGFDGNEEMTLKEIGKELSLHPERIRQIEFKALVKLRHPSRSRRLKDFLSEGEFFDWIGPTTLDRAKKHEAERKANEKFPARFVDRDVQLPKKIDFHTKSLDERTWYFVRDGLGATAIGLNEDIVTYSTEFWQVIESMRRFIWSTSRGIVVFDISNLSNKNEIETEIENKFSEPQKHDIRLVDSGNPEKTKLEDVISEISASYSNSLIISNIEDVLEYLPKEVRIRIPGLIGDGHKSHPIRRSV